MRFGTSVAMMLWLSLRVAAQVAAPEAALEPGPFAPIAGAHLGAGVLFENEIDGHVCHPLVIGGEIVAWLFRAYHSGDQLLVQRCRRHPSTEPSPAGRRNGGVNDWWEVLTVADGFRLSRLRLPLATGFSNPAFCGPLVAYWAFRGDELLPAVYHLTTRSFGASYSLGRAELATDFTGFLPDPVWNRTCSAATFDGRPAAKPSVTLVLRR